MSLNIENSIEKTKNFLGKHKIAIAGAALALSLAISDSNKNVDKNIPKYFGEFSLVKSSRENRNIYQYKIKKGDNPQSIAQQFNELDEKKGNIFKRTGNKNILENADGKEITNETKLQIGQIIYIKAKILKPKNSEYEYDFDQPENHKYRDNKEKSTMKKIEKKVIVDGKKEKITIIKDAGLNFYTIQENDFFPKCIITSNGKRINKCIDFEKIRGKLSKIDEFKYLEDNYYQRSERNPKTKKLTLKNNLYSFNISPIDIQKNFNSEKIKTGKALLPIPMCKEDRKLDIKSFAYYGQQAIEEMKNDHKYGPDMKELLSIATEEEILEALLTYAYCESSTITKETLGGGELHRREGGFNAYSFSYFHILMVKAGLAARTNLGLTEGECYHPKNASKLFIAFWIEKCKIIFKNPDEFFPLRKDNYEECARQYNGGNYKKNDYDNKLRINQEKVIRLLKDSKK